MSTEPRPSPPTPALTREPVARAVPDDWRWHHAHAATSLDDIERLFPGRFDMSALDRSGIVRAIARYGMRATPYYLDLARRAGASDPIWRLAVPDERETHVLPVEREDPIGDELPGLHPLPGVTRRYRDRALLFATPTCSVHCRHCFRKRMVGNAEYALDDAALEAALRWIAGEHDLREVILTGGDPLTLSDGRLVDVLQRLSRIEHLRSLRIHTRMPVVNPHRITPELAARLGACALPVVVVAHFNHAAELTDAASLAVQRLLTQGVATLNQSVLLAGVNDDVDSHRALLWALLDARIRPYALHHGDLVPGTSHLRTSVDTGLALMRALRGTVPGHALPRYLLDVPGGHGKVPLEPPWVTTGADGTLEIEAPDGSRQRYPPDGAPSGDRQGA